MPTEPPKIPAQQHIQQIIASCDSFLADTQEKTKEYLGNHQITEWNDVNFHHNAEALDNCGISSTLLGTRDHFRKELPTLLENLRHLENDLGNLKADFKLGSSPPESILPSARTLQAKQIALQELTDAIILDCKLLREAHITLHRNLTVDALMPLAKIKASLKGPIFDIGYKLYQLTTKNPDFDKNTKTLDDYLNEIVKQETLLSNIKLEKIPELASSTIKEQTKNALKATSLIKDGIDILRETFTIEHKHIKTTGERISQLNELDLLKILAQVDVEADALLSDIMRFHHKAHYMNKIYDIEETILLLQLLQRAIKKDLQKKLHEEIHDSNSKLNPTIAAANAAQKFLEGPKGFWRGSKMVVRLIMQKPIVNLAIFEKTLRETINTCPTLHAKPNGTDIPIDNFINEKLISYDSPFPRNDLYKITKDCLNAYNRNIERYCHCFKVDISSVIDKKGAVTLNKLINKILKNANKLIK